MLSLTRHVGFETLAGRMIRDLRRISGSIGAQILTYHSIGSGRAAIPDLGRIRHHPAEFDRHVDYLAARFRLVSLRDLLDDIRARRDTRGTAVITFDDGYRDILADALPMLARRRISATVFLTTSVIDNQDLLWQHKLSWLVARGIEPRIWQALRSEGFATGEPEEIGQYVRRCFRPEVTPILDSLIRSTGTSVGHLAQSLRLYLGSDDIRRANGELVQLENHTHTHPVLSSLTLNDQVKEIDAANSAITRITGIRPTALAYPFGLKQHMNEDSRSAVRACGLTAALDMRRRPHETAPDPLELSRKPAVIGSQCVFERMVEDWPTNCASNAPMEVSE